MNERGSSVIEFALLLPLAMFLSLTAIEIVLFVIGSILTQGAGEIAARAASLFDPPAIAAAAFLKQEKGVEAGLDQEGPTLIFQREAVPLFGVDIPGRPAWQRTSVPVVMRPCSVGEFEDNGIVQGALCD